MSDPAANEQIWRELLTGAGSRFERGRRRNRRVPGAPRCKSCLIPLSGPISRVLRLFNELAPSAMNPNFCNKCETFLRTHPGGAEIELTLLFADIRGSTGLAERMQPGEFRELLNRFYDSANRILIDGDALVDKLVGDEVIGLFLPAVGDHARKAVLAGRDLLLATGHADPNGPWVPVGVGVHTGTAYVGAVGSHSMVTDFTAIGDAVNVTARLASVAPAGALMISESSYAAVRDEVGRLEQRQLGVRGRDLPVDVRMLQLTPAPLAEPATP